MFEKHHVHLSQLAAIAHELLEKFADSRVFALYGKMGAGKTTFIQSVCAALGSPDTVTSPTFAIINEYNLPLGESVFHFDFYRIKNLEEAFDLGYEDYFYSGKYCLIEWPEQVEQVLPQKFVEIHISVSGHETRSIIAKLNEN